MFELTDEVAMVTGGASGIGAAAAEAVARQGASVALVDRPGASFDEAADAVVRTGRPVVTVEADVTSADDLASAVRRIETELGALTLAVNAAGIADAAPAEEMPFEQWRRVYAVDVDGVFLSCQAQAAVMLPRGRGSIVNIASMSGSIVNRGLTQAHYNSAKAAVIHLSRSLAMEWAGAGVRVNAVSPGYTATPMNLRPEVAEQAKQFAADTPLGRMAEPSEIAGPVVFLLSPAASFCTGVDLVVDGGFTCW